MEENRRQPSRVLVIAPQPFYEDRGTPIAIHQLLRALSQLAYEVDVLTYPVGQTIDIPGVRYFRCPNPFGVRRVPIGLSLRKLLLDLALLPALFGRLRKGRYCCIHAVEEAAFPAVLLGRRFGVPVIYDMQSSLPEQLGQHLAFRPRPVQGALRRTERWLLSRADSVVSSAGLAPGVRALAPGARLREWHYASLRQVEEGEADGLRAELGIPPGRPVVVYSGTFEPYQGLGELAEAMPLVLAAVPEAIFVLVGALEQDGTAALHRHAELVRRGSLRVVRRQPRESVPRFLALADVLVSPRAWGGNLPLKVFDYLAAGRPIVATDIPAHRSVLGDDRALLTGTSAAEIAAGIVRLLEDRELATRLAAGARDYAERSLGWNGFVRSVAEIYREVDRGATSAEPRSSTP